MTDEVVPKSRNNKTKYWTLEKSEKEVSVLSFSVFPPLPTREKHLLSQTERRGRVR